MRSFWIPILLGACCLSAQEPLPIPRISGFTVVDTIRDVEIGPLEEGGTVHSQPFRSSSSNRSVIVRSIGAVDSIDVRVDHVTAGEIGRTYTDRTSPHTACGEFTNADGETKLWGCPAFRPEGEAVIVATPWINGQRGTGLSVSFTIARGDNPELEPDEEPTPDIVRSSGDSSGDSGAVCYFAGSDDDGEFHGLEFGDKIDCPDDYSKSHNPRWGRDGPRDYGIEFGTSSIGWVAKGRDPRIP